VAPYIWFPYVWTAINDYGVWDMTLHGFVPSEEPAAYFQYIMVTDCQLQAYIPRQRQMSPPEH